MTFDFDAVSCIGRAFADEIFRMFEKRPNEFLTSLAMELASTDIIRGSDSREGERKAVPDPIDSIGFGMADLTAELLGQPKSVAAGARMQRATA